MIDQLDQKKVGYFRYYVIKAALENLRDELTKSGKTMCDFAMEIDGVLKDQASYYIASYEDIKRGISEKGNVIMENLT